MMCFLLHVSLTLLKSQCTCTVMEQSVLYILRTHKYPRRGRRDRTT